MAFMFVKILYCFEWFQSSLEAVLDERLAKKNDGVNIGRWA